MENQDAGWRGKLAGGALAFALFAVLWYGAAAIGTRLGLWSWQFGLHALTESVGPKLLVVSLALAVMALVAAALKAPRKRAVMLALAALLVSSLALGRFAAYGAQAERLPPLYDVQTDWDDPVRPSEALLAARAAGGAVNPMADDPVISAEADARWPGMAGQRFADVQKQAEFVPGEQKSPRAAPYPLLAPLVQPGASPEEGYRAALAAVEARGWEVVRADADAGQIEATATEFWYGFRDDILIRVRTEDGGVRIDVRAASRVGLTDLGANAKRIRSLLDEIEVRLNKGRIPG
ncbi:MAG: DUF1499 domain-containing protein [Hyphomonas sp.]